MNIHVYFSHIYYTYIITLHYIIRLSILIHVYYIGMIEPNMATMLSYIVTDLTISRDQLDSILRETVDVSYNTISVDGDQSTSDTGE